MPKVIPMQLVCVYPLGLFLEFPLIISFSFITKVEVEKDRAGVWTGDWAYHPGYIPFIVEV